MKRRQMSDCNYTQNTKSMLKLPALAPAQGKRERYQMLSVADMQTIQSELQSIQGYSITPGTLAYLSHYCRYYSLLKEAILNREEARSQGHRFMREHNLLHSEDSVSKLFNGLIEKDEQMRKNNKLYGQECLFDYFRLKDFTSDKIVATLIRRIIDAKRRGIIEYQDRPKKGRSYYGRECKENKGKILSQSNPKFKFEQNKVYYSIMALRLLLKDAVSKMQQISKTCEQIKVSLELFLGSLKVRQGKGLKMQRSSLFKRNQ